MNLSAPFISRPVATTLLTIGLMLVGVTALQLLPVSPLPRVDIPTIKVSASLPGASPETMASAVTTPLERSLGRIAGITEMTSTSALGATRIVLQFNLNRDINGAARDVQAALNAAQSALPAEMPSKPAYRKVNPGDAPIMILSLTSASMTQGQLYDAASTVIAQKLSQLKGVGDVEIGGGALPAVRVDLNPNALQQYGIGLDDVRKAISTANSNRPQGGLEDVSGHWQISSNGQARNATDYAAVIIKYQNGGAVRLTDVAVVADSIEDVRTAGLANGQPAVLVIIKRESDANIIATVNRINQVLPTLKASIPAAIDLTVAMERTSTVRAAIRDAGYTLIFAVLLVILVVFMFLRNGRAALVPIVAVPVSLIGTFAAMYMLDYSLNTLSLMALTIAVGFVVDDAIVVLENVSRHIESGMAPKQAANIGAKEVGVTVLSMTLVIIAVFIPMLLMGGYVGLFVREFVVTLVVAILISLVVSLTTVPMMCAYLLKPTGPVQTRHSFYQWSEGFFDRLLQAYKRSLTLALKHAPLTMLILLATVCLNIFLYTIIAKGFFPPQDTGQLTGRIQGDQSASFQVMQKKLTDFINIIRLDPAVETAVGYTGGGGQRNSGSLFVSLKPLSERKEGSDKVITRLRDRLANEPGATLILNPVQDIRIGGRQSRSSYEYTIQADDLELLHHWEPAIRRALAKVPELLDLDTDVQDKGLQTTLAIDRDAAARLGISAKQIDSLLNNAFTQRSASSIYQSLNHYQVVMGLAPEYAQSAKALDHLFVSGSDGHQVPLSMVASYKQTEAALQVNHHAQFAATTISFNLPKGVSLSKATHLIDEALQDVGLPTSVRGSFQGSAKAFKEMLNNQPILILAAFLSLYIVLGVLYESLIHPLTILSTLPSAGVGALLALMLFQTGFSVIAMIGIFMLIGVVMKNAIMMIDFALDTQRKSSASPEQAIFEACLLRFRPILMTSLAALLASIPLALGHGDGAEMRQPLGIAIGGGLIMSQLLTLYTTPVVYLYLDRLSSWMGNLFKLQSNHYATHPTNVVVDSAS
ncbi:MAG: multidrug transporter subunit MdtC [Methylotenera sp.]|nr:multidrug transporter subunit MdtC [Methylotenera sp.]MSP99803.1 multidrug transporter subunit MdtC [Methylotenera sp.]